MNRLTKISIAIACALGVTAVAAQTVQRDGQTVKPAQTRAPVQVSQTVFGGPAAGATPAPVAATAGAATVGAVFFVGVGLAVAASASQSSDTPFTHIP